MKKAVWILIFLACLPVGGAEVIVSLDDSLKELFYEIKDEQEKAAPDQVVTLNFGNPEMFERQLTNAFPADVIITPSAALMKKLVEKKLVDDTTLFPLASNHLVVAGHKEGKKITTLEDLKAEEIARIGVADEKETYLGVVTRETLEKSGLFQKLEPKLDKYFSVNNLLGSLDDKSIPVAILFNSDLVKRESLQPLLSLENNSDGLCLYQAAVIVRPKDMSDVVPKVNVPAATAFLEFLKKDEGRKILQKHGFVPTK